MTMTLEAEAAQSLKAAREAAWSLFKSSSDPLKTAETWRRVSYQSWALDALTPESGRRSWSCGLSDGGAAEAEELKAKGVVLCGLMEAADTHASIVAPFLKTDSGEDFKKLDAANLALFSGGWFLYVPKGVRIDKPIELPFVQAASPCAFARSIVVIEEGADVAIFESHRSSGEEKSTSVIFSKVQVGPSAKVRWFYDQSLNLNTAHFWHQRVTLGRDALIQHYSALFGSSVHKSELDIQLAGQGARSELYGILFGSKGQLFDPHTVQWHKASRTTSDLLFKSALRGRARSIYTGLIRIERDALGCEAFQQNNNLLLTNDARADTTPVLEILTDDVRCKHGATVGPVNPDELFYLQSRGLDEAAATKLLVAAFLEPILGKIPLASAKERLAGEVERRLA